MRKKFTDFWPKTFYKEVCVVVGGRALLNPGEISQAEGTVGTWFHR
jgi:hypothetical protein